MKILLTLVLSLLIHCYLLTVEALHQPVLVAGAAPAQVIGLNIVQAVSKPQIEQVITAPPQPQQAVNTTIFQGDKLFAKQTENNAVTVEHAAKVKPIEPIEPIKAELTPDKVPEKVVVEARPTEPVPTKENSKTSIASAKLITEKIGLRDTPLDLEQPPLFKQPRPPLSYPNKARRRGYQGITLLMISLDTSGAIEKVAIVRSSGYQILDKAALKNVAKWQFHPVKVNGETVKARFQVPINFALNS